MSSGSLFESLPSEKSHFGRCFISPLMESPRPREVHRAFTYGTGVGINQQSWHVKMLGLSVTVLAALAVLSHRARWFSEVLGIHTGIQL